MGRGRSLAYIYKGYILAFQNECWSIRQIEFKIDHSNNVVATFLRNPKQYVKYIN